VRRPRLRVHHREGRKPEDLPLQEKQRAAIFQLSVASEVFVFQIVHTDAVPEALRKFLGDESIRFCSAAIGNDLKMLEYYGRVAIPRARNLQRVIPNRKKN
jgi:hypothetical protein